MIIDRRAVLAAAPALAASLAWGASPPPALAAYERESGGRVGLFARNVATGMTIAWRADERFAMCSTFKASLAACILARVDRGADRLDALVSYGPGDLLDYAPVARQHLAQGALSVGDMCAAAVELSDNTCANLLLARIGGPSALTTFWRATGDTISRLDHNEPQLNRSLPGDPHDTTTPTAIAETLRRLVFGDVLSASSQDRLKDWMVNCRTGGNRLRAGLPAAWTVGDKTGNNGADASGDIAVAQAHPQTPIVIAAYTQGGTPSAVQLLTVFGAIGRMVSDRLG